MEAAATQEPLQIFRRVLLSLVFCGFLEETTALTARTLRPRAVTAESPASTPSIVVPLWKRALFSGIFFGLAFSVTFLMIEIGIRAYAQIARIPLVPERNTYIDNPHFVEKFDPVLGWALRPSFTTEDGIVRTNRLGLRSSREFEPGAREPGKKRVLVLGDSMVFGLAMPQAEIFTEVVNRESKDLVLINTGVIGYCTAQEYLVQKRFSPSLRPEVTVLFYTQDNDMWWNPRTDHFNPGFSLEGDKLIGHETQRRYSPPLYKYSALYQLLDNRFLYRRDLLYLWNRVSFELRPDGSYPWRVTKRILAEMKREADSVSSRMILFDIPTHRQLGDARVSRKRQELLHATTAELGIEYYDLTSYYPMPYGEIFLPEDTHWNKEGHDFIAHLLEKILASAKK